jgi:hypothetical protein
LKVRRSPELMREALNPTGNADQARWARGWAESSGSGVRAWVLSSLRFLSRFRS